MRSTAPPTAIWVALALVTAASLLLRTGTLDAGYWIDEAISVGIASHDLADIPRALRLDGSPPLYYLLLHGWLQLFGDGEAATRALSLTFALLAVPVAWWAAGAVFDRRAAALAAVAAAACPFLTHYAQEARMYSLVVVLSLLACASFVLAFVRGRRLHLAALACWLTLLLYTHNWALFLAAGMAIAWLAMWRAGSVDGRDGAKVGAVVAVLYAPWVPSVAFQAAHTGAPWAAQPSLLYVLGAPGALFGYVATPLLAVAVLTAVRRRPPRDAAVRGLVVLAVATIGVAWVSSQIEPAWSPRYLAVLFGPLLLALVATVRDGTRATAAALVGVAAIWLLSLPPPVKSNVRGVATAIAARDLVVSTQPEQVPVLYRYLPSGVVYLTPLGIVPDPRNVDWRDGLAQLRAGRAERRLVPLLDRLAPGRRVALVTPVRRRSAFDGPWTRVVRRRTREWRAALHRHPRLRALRRVAPFPPGRHGVRLELFVVIS
jgi:mannosyltransferase